MQKISSLESLRGVAALIVVFTHFAFAFFPSMVYGQTTSMIHSNYEVMIMQSPLGIFISGRFAVACFFVLSGFVLSYSFFKRGGADLVASVLRRYFRLLPVVLASILLAYFLLKVGFFYNQSASQITGSDWLSLFWLDSEITFSDALWHGLIGVFSTASTPQSLNPVLWTIYYELIGSVLVYALLSLFGKDSRRWYVYIVLIIVLSNTYFLGFIVGMMLCDVFINKPSIISKLSNAKKGYKFALLILGIYLASYPAYITSFNDLGLIHAPLRLFTDTFLTHNVLYVTASSIIVVLLVSGSRMSRLFERRPFVYLGGISYSLYATHFLVLGTFASWLFVKLTTFLPYNYAALVTFVGFVIVTIIIATLFKKYIDDPSIKLSKRIIKSNK